MGTDAGVAGTYHGWSTLHEMELLVSSGLTPMQAITAGTGTSARLVGEDKERGTIAPGKIADLLLIKGLPDQNIEEIENTSAVFLADSSWIYRRSKQRFNLRNSLRCPPTPFRP